MNNDYEFNVQEGICLNKQILSEETNNIFALIYIKIIGQQRKKKKNSEKDEEERKLNEEKLEHIFDRKDKGDNRRRRE